MREMLRPGGVRFRRSKEVLLLVLRVLEDPKHKNKIQYLRALPLPAPADMDPNGLSVTPLLH